MQVRPFLISKDYEQLNQFNQSWGFPAVSYEDAKDILPKTGFIIEGVGCVFVYLTDTAMAYIDQMTLNKNVSEEIRHEAGKLLIEALMLFAQLENIKMFSWNTAHKSIDKYALHAGAFQLDQRPHQQWFYINKQFNHSQYYCYYCNGKCNRNHPG